MAQEMVLIPKATYERLRDSVNDDDKKTLKEKESSYSSDIKNDNDNTKESSITDDRDQPEHKTPMLQLSLVEQFPENYRLYAKRLLGYIRKHGSSILGWIDNDNTLLYRETAVTGTNIVDLIIHQFKTNSSPPKGNERFKKGLSELKVPKAYLKPYLLKPPTVTNKLKKSWLKY
jgi:hypothetical protein